jgi:hypothetical protein
VNRLHESEDLSNLKIVHNLAFFSGDKSGIETENPTRKRNNTKSKTSLDTEDPIKFRSKFF